MIRAQILRQAATSNRVIEHPAQSRTVYCCPVDPKPNDPPRKLVHHDQDPMGCQRCRFAPEQITTPQAVLHMAEKTSAKMGRNPSQAGSEGSGFGELCPYRSRGQKPKSSAGRFTDSPSGDSAVSS